MLDRVYIQKKGGEFATINGWAAWFGFERQGYPISFFEWPQMRDGEIDLTPETMVVGGVGTVRFALEQLHAAPPTIDFPESLRGYLGRKVWSTTMGEVRQLFMGDDPSPLFVKPREVHKAFTGYVLLAFRDLIPTAHQSDELALWASEVVEFVSEWRYFVHGNEIIGVGHYQGDPLTHPDTAIIRRAVADHRAEAPAGYELDFGVTNDGRTLLVEVNDAYSLGHIGLRAVPYANMLESRWRELMAKRGVQ